LDFSSIVSIHLHAHHSPAFSTFGDLVVLIGALNIILGYLNNPWSGSWLLVGILSPVQILCRLDLIVLSLTWLLAHAKIHDPRITSWIPAHLFF
jgi:hypothetical protein